MNQQSKNIYLIGFMGSGKTTFGKLLAEVLQMNFIDIDAEIEQWQGKTIADLFASGGEVNFRQLEREMLHRCSEKGVSLISTGGGAPCFFDNMDYMNGNGLTVYLQASAEELFKKLKPFREKRPLLRDKSDKELLDYIQEKLKEREPYYFKAGIILPADEYDPEVLIQRFRFLTSL